MKGRNAFLALAFIFLLVLAFLSQVVASGYTRIRIREAGTGREVHSEVLCDGEEVVLTWKNSLFGLKVTEVFVARGSVLVLSRVSFCDPHGSSPPTVTPADVEDLYQTGDPFSASGLSKPFRQIVYRVGEIGDPRMRVGRREVAFREEVGFGGSIVLTATTPRAYEILLERGHPEQGFFRWREKGFQE
jgi:hypothetical protein